MTRIDPSPASGPFAAAAACGDRDGLVLLESTLAAGGARSLLAVDPREIIEGGPGDWTLLESAVEGRQGADSLAGGAAIGWVGFDGSFRFGLYDRVAVYEHDREVWLGAPPAATDPAPGELLAPIDFRPTMEREHFLDMVRRALDYIAAGDIYQVCLAHRFEAEAAGPAWPYYAALRQCSPAPYSAYLRLGGTAVVSSSPECFLRMDGRAILTRPIKGTRPRGRDQADDDARARDLLTSAKEAAELVMITDLERNDLGQVCEYGSVQVPDLLALESYRQVHHLVSTVTGRLRPEVSHCAALRACLPGGSISGAPKKRALEIIAELEPAPRGIYTGAIGYLGFNGESQFSIAIRTAVFENGRASFHVGAGIVADSRPEKEWQETLDKAAGLLQAARP